MAVNAAARHEVTQEPFERHLEAREVAAYVDGTVAGETRSAIQAHLAACAECRAEVADVSRVVRTLPRAPGQTGPRVWLAGAAAAAAAVLLTLAWPRTTQEPSAPEMREGAVTATVAPRPIAPAGAVDSARLLVWSSVPSAERYRARLFDSASTVLWEGEGEDTVVALPASVTLRAGRSYYWRVEAYTGFDRAASSDLVEFTLGRGGRR